MSNAEVVKKLEAEKAKAENDAKVAKKQSDSLALILVQRTADLDNCKKNSTQNNADIEKMKKCEDNNALLKAEMTEMTKTISRLNTKNYNLSNQVDSLVNELKNCCKNCGTGNNTDAEALKKCQSNNAELNAEINKLKAVIAAQDKSLDSMKVVVSDQSKKQVELNATITKLNTDISDLKSKGSNCEIRQYHPAKPDQYHHCSIKRI
jgi:chromosome segregation ATPase